MNNDGKKEINEAKANEIARKLSDPYERIKLYVGMWFPMERFYYPGETEDQRIGRHYQQLMAEEEVRNKEDEQRDRRNLRRRVQYRARKLRNEKAS